MIPSSWPPINRVGRCYSVRVIVYFWRCFIPRNGSPSTTAVNYITVTAIKLRVLFFVDRRTNRARGFLIYQKRFRRPLQLTSLARRFSLSVYRADRILSTTSPIRGPSHAPPSSPGRAGDPKFSGCSSPTFQRKRTRVPIPVVRAGYVS